MRSIRKSACRLFWNYKKLRKVQFLLRLAGSLSSSSGSGCRRACIFSMTWWIWIFIYYISKGVLKETIIFVERRSINSHINLKIIIYIIGFYEDLEFLAQQGCAVLSWASWCPHSYTRWTVYYYYFLYIWVGLDLTDYLVPMLKWSAVSNDQFFEGYFSSIVKST